MLNEIKLRTEKFLKSLDENVTISKREFVLAIAVCTLLGIVIGALFSPRKNITIGSHNGSENYNYGSEDEDEEE